MSYVWIATDIPDHDNETIYAVCRTAEGAKAEVEADHRRHYPEAVFDWSEGASGRWLVEVVDAKGWTTEYCVERFEVSEA